MTIFFTAYIFLLKHPAFPVTVIPAVAIDRWVGFEPLALPLYLSLWFYVSLPPMLMTTRNNIARYGGWIGLLCVLGLAIFYVWPTAVPPTHIDWTHYPAVYFLKNVDASGNACPSLHVATAVFTALWLHRQLPHVGLRKARIFSALWCVTIAYSTLATKQHMAIDVMAGVLLGAAVALPAIDRFYRVRST